MKKFLTLFLLLVYTTVSGGVPVFLQQCKEQVVAVRVGVTSGEECKKGCSSDESGKKCCKFTLHKLQATKSSDSFLDNPQKFLLNGLLPAYPTTEFLFPKTSIQVEHTQSNGPPLDAKVALYIQNCSFLI
ncbi:hypothetical protein [Rufibacter immobilis]|uniref:hypothetical protein n=1 Tax=Rufibacter immobilis TaxID=1348778 RepID=UPI0035ED86F1